jgi:hypothetical protein
MCDLHRVLSLGILLCRVPNPVTDVDRLRLKIEERVWRAPPTLDAKHLWFMFLEKSYFSWRVLFILLSLTEVTILRLCLLILVSGGFVIHRYLFRTSCEVPHVLPKLSRD